MIDAEMELRASDRTIVGCPERSSPRPPGSLTPSPIAATRRHGGCLFAPTRPRANFAELADILTGDGAPDPAARRVRYDTTQVSPLSA